MKLTTSRMVPESGIENVVAALMREVNLAICPNMLPGMIENIPLTVLKAFQTYPEIKKIGRVAIAPGKTPKELRVYILNWEQGGGGYNFSFSSVNSGGVASEVESGYNAMCK